MPEPRGDMANEHTPKFQLVSNYSYPELQAIVKKRLPISVQFYNSLQLALTGDNSDIEFYVYNGVLNAHAMVVMKGRMQMKETDPGTMMTFLSVPNPGQSVTPEFAKDLVFTFTRSDRNLSYAIERNSSPLIIQALLNQGHIVEARSCDTTCSTKSYHSLSINSLPENCILKQLEPEDAHTVTADWKFILWDHPEYYARKCIERNPSAGIYSTVNGELMSWAICYNFGSVGMLHTPEKYRGKGLAKIVMQHILNGYLARGLYPAAGVEPRNAISARIMSQLGLERNHSVDFIFTS